MFRRLNDLPELPQGLDAGGLPAQVVCKIAQIPGGAFPREMCFLNRPVSGNRLYLICLNLCYDRYEIVEMRLTISNET